MSDDNKLAMVGIGCRLSAGVDGPSKMWTALWEGHCGVSRVPPGRWPNVQGLPEAALWGGFLPQINTFDPGFFGISNREAPNVDPQQRLFLELVWEALEDAGMPLSSLRGKDIGVFVGVSNNDYARLQLQGHPELSAYAVTGSALSIVANRVSYLFDFHGPSLAVDTACSSSLVALHLAAEAIRKGECSVAVVGGVNHLLTPAVSVGMARMNALSASGHCAPFSADANGYVRGEGGAVVVLKPLQTAREDGDRIYSVLLGSAVNQDGLSNGLTAPNQQAQETVLRRAYAAAGVDPSHVQVIEAHGTGTPLGDPIEAQALASVLGPRPSAVERFWLSSAKSNFGHLEAAAGVVGAIKLSLTLHRRALPRQLHFGVLNPHLNASQLTFEIPVRNIELEKHAQILGGVSSFGFGGTNAHAVFASAPQVTRKPRRTSLTTTAGADVPLVVSAKDFEALKLRVAQLADQLESLPVDSLQDLSFTLTDRREHLPHRFAVVANHSQKAAVFCREWLQSNASVQTVVWGHSRGKIAGKTAFVFSGHGSQWLGMGRELYQQSETFRAAIDECEEAIRTTAGWSPRHHLLENTELEDWATQPVIFCAQYGLSAVWKELGVTPDVVLGHSMGEVAAACVCGALSLRDAAKIICKRSELLAQITGQGAMALIHLSAQALEPWLSPSDHIDIAATNGPNSTVVAGATEAVADLLARLNAGGVFARKVNVPVASHSTFVEPLLPALRDHLRALAPTSGNIPFLSSVEARVKASSELDADYWCNNLRRPVRFGEAALQLKAMGVTTMVEIAPHPVLTPDLQALLADDHDLLVVSSTRRNAPELSALCLNASKLFVAGRKVALSKFGIGDAVVEAHGQPYSRKTFWIPQTEAGPLPYSAPAGRNAMLGTQTSIQLAPLVMRWERDLQSSSFSWLKDHSVQGTVIMPGTGFLEMALEAGYAQLGSSNLSVCDAEIHRPLALPRDTSRKLRVESHARNTGLDVVISSSSNGEDETLHLTAHVSNSQEQPATGALSAVQKRVTSPVDVEGFYQRLAVAQNHYGPTFRGIQSIHSAPSEALCRIECPKSLETQFGDFVLHPVLLDTCGHALVAASGVFDAPFVSTGMKHLFASSTLEGSLWAHAKLTHQDRERVQGNITIWNHTGELLACLEGVELLLVDEHSLRTGRSHRNWLHRVKWTELFPRQEAKALPPVEGWILVEDELGLSQNLKSVLLQAGYPRVVSLKSSDEPVMIPRVQPSSDALTRWMVVDLRLFRQAKDDLQDIQWIANHLQELSSLRSLASTHSKSVELWSISSCESDIEQPSLFCSLGQALSRTLGVEWDGLWRGHLSVNTSIPLEVAAKRIFDELMRASSEPERHLSHDNQTWVPRLTRIKPAFSADSRRSVGSGSTYLITGGLGGIGLFLAEWLVHNGARRLILASRRGLPPRTAGQSQDREQEQALLRKVEELERLGATIDIVALDVSNETEVQAFFEARQRSKLPSITGVFHAAGHASEVPLDAVTEEEVRQTLAGKVFGALFIDRALRDTPLEFFVHFSSASVFLGSPKLAIYAAANACLESIAVQQRRRGVAAYALSWGAWGGAGMATRWNTVASDYLLPMPPTNALRALWDCLSIDAANTMVARVDWKELSVRSPRFASNPLYAELSMARADQVAKASETADPEKPTQTSAKDVTSFVRTLVARGLRVEPEELDLAAPLKQLGLDSLMGTEIRHAIEVTWGVDVGLVSLLDKHSVLSLSQALTERLLQPVKPPKPSEDVPEPQAFPLVVVSSPPQAQGRFFCVHPGFSASAWYAALASEMKTPCAFYAIEMRLTGPMDSSGSALQKLDFHGQTMPVTRIEDVAAMAIERIKAEQPSGPYLLGGWCSGGVVAFEAAQQLRRRGEQVEHLVLFDSPVPRFFQPDAWGETHFLTLFARDLAGRTGKPLAVTFERLAQLPAEDQLREIHAQAISAGIFDRTTEFATVERLYLIHRHAVTSTGVGPVRNYSPLAYEAPVTVFVAQEQFMNGRPGKALGWVDFVGPQISWEEVPGDHFSMFAGNNAKVLGVTLDRCLGPSLQRHKL